MNLLLFQLKYKKRVYKMLNLDEKSLKQLHSKTNLKKFLEFVEEKESERVEKLCTQGLDPNFHDNHGGKLNWKAWRRKLRLRN